MSDEDGRKRLDFLLTTEPDADLDLAPDWWFGEDEAEQSSMAAFEALR